MNAFAFMLLSGFALGVIHSFDPDHVAAMTTLLGRERDRAAHAFAKGLIWGVGHTLSLLALGLVLALTNAQLSGSWERAFEIAVGLLLVYLGARRLHDAMRRVPHLHGHRHGDMEHAHYHLHSRHTDHASGEAHGLHSHAPLWIGILHGFAGTAALMALLPAMFIDHLDSYLSYVLMFGLGSTLSMGAFCAGVDQLMLKLRDTRRSIDSWWAASAGSLSFALGILWLGSVLLG